MTGPRQDEAPLYTVRRFPVHDTWIGRAAGFFNDAELIRAHEATLNALGEVERQLVEECMKREVELFVNGKRIV